jgi:hypothetical protein
MEKQDFGYGLDVPEDEAERMFLEVAKKYVESLNLPSFNPEGLELARSEKEIAKCITLREKEDLRNLKREERMSNNRVERRGELKRSESKRGESKRGEKKEEMTRAKKMFKKTGSSGNSKGNNRSSSNNSKGGSRSSKFGKK